MTTLFSGPLAPSEEQQPVEVELDASYLRQSKAIVQQVTKKKWFNFSIRTAVTLLLFAFLFKSLSWSRLWVTLVHANNLGLLLGLTVGVIGLVVSCYQWQTLLRAEHIFMSFTRLMKLYLVGIGFSHFLPTGIGGDAVKAIYVGRESRNGAGSVSAVLMSRITGFYGMLFVAVPALIIWSSHFTHTIAVSFLLLSLMIASTSCGAILFATLIPKLFGGRWAKRRIFASAIRIGDAISMSARKPRSLGMAILFGFLFHIIACLNYYSYALALHMDVPLYFYFVAIPLVSLIAFLPISINGFGVRESSFVYIFSVVHVAVATSLLLAFLIDIQVLFFGAIGGGIYFTMSSKAKVTRQLPIVRPTMDDYTRTDPQMSQFDEEVTVKMEKPVRYQVLVPEPVREQEHQEQAVSNLEQEESEQRELRSTDAVTSEEQLPQEELRSADAVTSEETEILPTTPPRFSKRQGRFKTYNKSMNWKTRRAVVISVVICLLALSGAIGFYETTQVPGVTTYQVSAQNVNQSIGGGGIVFPRQRIDVSYPAPERVVAVLVKTGDQVSPDQPLIRLDAAQLTAEVAQAADDLAAAKTYLDNVLLTGNAVTIAQARQAYNIAKDKYDALVAKTSSPTLRNDTLVSPISGIVTSVNIDPGELFTSNAPLLTIMDESIVIVHVKVPLSNLGQVHLGQPATVTPSALPNLDFHGTVSSIVPKADPQTDTFEVWVQVVNPDGTLLPGMSAFVRIQIGSKTLVLPRLAVLNPDREANVFVVRNDHAYLQHVHIVGRSVDTIFVDAGVSAGDKVVLVGLDKLQNGQRVHVTHTER